VSVADANTAPRSACFVFALNTFQRLKRLIDLESCKLNFAQLLWLGVSARPLSKESSLGRKAFQKRLSAGYPADVLGVGASGYRIEFVDAAKSKCSSCKQDLAQFAKHVLQQCLLIANPAVSERKLQQLL